MSSHLCFFQGTSLQIIVNDLDTSKILEELGKSDKMQDEFYKFNNTGAQMLDSIII